MAATFTKHASTDSLELDVVPQQRAPGADEPGDAAAVRDRLTRRALRAVPERPAESDVVRFRRRWWDGAAYVPTVVVRSRRGRYRLAETAGSVAVLPASPRRARRALSRLRRPVQADSQLLTLARNRATAGLVLAGRTTVVRLPDDLPRGRPSLPARPLGLAPLVRIEQRADAVRCSGRGCSVLVPVPPPGRLGHPGPRGCPSCGHGG